MSDSSEESKAPKSWLKKEETKEEPKAKVKVGDSNKDGFKVIEILSDGRLVVSSSSEAKVIKASEF